MQILLILALVPLARTVFFQLTTTPPSTPSPVRIFTSPPFMVVSTPAASRSGSAFPAYFASTTPPFRAGSASPLNNRNPTWSPYQGSTPPPLQFATSPWPSMFTDYVTYPSYSSNTSFSNYYANTTYTYKIGNSSYNFGNNQWQLPSNYFMPSPPSQNKSVSVDKRTFTVNGALSVNNGTLYLNNGTLFVQNGTLFPNTGTLSVQSGTLLVKTGTYLVKVGTFVINGTLSVNNGSLHVLNGTTVFHGTLLVNNGTLLPNNGDLGKKGMFLVNNKSNTSALIWILPPATTTPKPTRNCNYQLGKTYDFAKALIKCTLRTGFVANFAEPNGSAFIEAIESVSTDENCLGRCILEESFLLNYKNGSLRKDEFKRLFQSNATWIHESTRITGWKTCAEKIEKEAQPFGGVQRYCKYSSKFLACGLQVEQDSRRAPGCILR